MDEWAAASERKSILDEIASNFCNNGVRGALTLTVLVGFMVQKMAVTSPIRLSWVKQRGEL